MKPLQRIGPFWVYVVTDSPVHAHVFHKRKRRFGPRWQKVRRFIRWENRMRDGEIIRDEYRDALYMNERTLSDFRKMVEQENRRRDQLFGQATLLRGMGGMRL